MAVARGPPWTAEIIPRQSSCSTSAIGKSAASSSMEIHSNTFYWIPAANAPTFCTRNARYAGPIPRFFKNNIVLSNARLFAAAGIQLDHNL